MVRLTNDRRTFLGGAAVLASAPLGSMMASAKQGAGAPSGTIGKGGVTPKDFGAIGDGKTNDFTAVHAAIAYALDNDLPVDGGQFEYGVSGGIEIFRRLRPHIRTLRLKQLNPRRQLTTLRFKHCQQVLIDSLSVDVGDSKRAGHMTDTVGVLIEGGSGHLVNNLTATGNGNVTYVRLWQCTGSTFENVHVHDGEFENFEEELIDQDDMPIGTVRVPDDVVQGIHMADCIDCSLVNPIVRNLTGNARTFNTKLEVKDFPNFRTRGICGGGNKNCTIANPKVTNVEQAIDFSGSGNNWGNINLQVIGGHTRNCGSVGVKLANAPNGCKVVGHIAENCGGYCYLLTGTSPHQRGIDNSFIDCEAINPGYNDVANDTDAEPLAHAGFTLLQDAPGGLVGSRIVNCRALDKQGFYLATDDSPWAPAGAVSATMAEAWTGYTGQYQATFTTGSGTETRSVLLTQGSTNLAWAGGLAGAIIHPFVARPPKMQFGALCEAPYYPASGRPNLIEGFESVGHIKSAEKGFQRYRAHLKGAAFQSVPHNISVPVTWEIETDDTVEMHSTDSNPSRIVFPRAGLYRLHGTLFFASNGTGYRRVEVRQGGVLQFNMAYAAVSGANSAAPFDVELTIIAAGQYVEIFAAQTSGGELNMDKASSFAIVELVRLG